MKQKSSPKPAINSSRDVIIRTEQFAQAVKYYGQVLGLPASHRGKTLVGFETGSFCLYVEKGKKHGPVFDFLVPDVRAEKRRLLAAGCKLIEENPAVPRCYLKDAYGVVFNLGQA